LSKYHLLIAISTQLLGECFFTTYYEMKIKKYTVPTIHRNKVGIGKFDIPHTNKHDRSWLSRSISGVFQMYFYIHILYIIYIYFNISDFTFFVQLNNFAGLGRKKVI
jgi:hypothetical protein